MEPGRPMAQGAGRTFNAAFLCLAVRVACRCSARATTGPCAGTVQPACLTIPIPLHEPASARDGYWTTDDARICRESWFRATHCDYGLWPALRLSPAIQARAAHDNPWSTNSPAASSNDSTWPRQRSPGFATGINVGSPRKNSRGNSKCSGFSTQSGSVHRISRSGTFPDQVMQANGGQRNEGDDIILWLPSLRASHLCGVANSGVVLHPRASIPAYA